MNELNSSIQVFIDGGVKKGSDIFKCLALGADYVFLGRGFIFSLVDGEEGIHNAFEILKKELKTTMRLCCVKSVAEINESFIKVLKPISRL